MIFGGAAESLKSETPRYLLLTGGTPALQIHRPMDGRFDLDFGKQVGKQFAAGAARKIRGWRIPIQIIGTGTSRRLLSGCVPPLEPGRRRHAKERHVCTSHDNGDRLRRCSLKAP